MTIFYSSKLCFRFINFHFMNCINTVTDYELLSPLAQMHEYPPTLFVQKWVQMREGGSGASY